MRGGLPKQSLGAGVVARAAVQLKIPNRGTSTIQDYNLRFTRKTMKNKNPEDKKVRKEIHKESWAVLLAARFRKAGAHSARGYKRYSKHKKRDDYDKGTST